jgi:hypothetical protein
MEPIKTYITYDQFDVARLTSTQPEKKKVPGTGEKGVAEQNYFQIPLMYDYGTPGKKILGEFKIEGPVMSSTVGIQTKPNLQGVMASTIGCVANILNEDHKKFISDFDEIYQRSAELIYDVRIMVKLQYFNKECPRASKFNNPVYRPVDEATNQVIEGRNPSLYLKLFSRGKEPYGEQTLFTNLKGEPIPWNLLKNVEMKFIPLIHVKRIYVGGNPSLQMELVSAVVVEARARNSFTQQTETLKKYQEENPDLADVLSAQLAKLATDRQDQMLGVNPLPCVDIPGQVSQPTFAGITPTQQEKQKPTMSVINEIPKGINLPNLQDFTSLAPMKFN